MSESGTPEEDREINNIDKQKETGVMYVQACVCVCACVRACIRAYVLAYVSCTYTHDMHVRAYMGTCMRVCVCVITKPHNYTPHSARKYCLFSMP